ncbi:MAG: hypothetical protein JSR36_08975 [Proteobacteria bacterium]|nr:hypothetical protein [Pseudomonadota bacterium]
MGTARASSLVSAPLRGHVAARCGASGHGRDRDGDSCGHRSAVTACAGLGTALWVFQP